MHQLGAADGGAPDELGGDGSVIAQHAARLRRVHDAGDIRIESRQVVGGASGEILDLIGDRIVDRAGGQLPADRLCPGDELVHAGRLGAGVLHLEFPG